MTTKYIVTVFANENHSDTDCAMDGTTIATFNSRELAERLIARLEWRYHTLEITAIVEDTAAENAALRTENAALRTENAELRATIDARDMEYIDRSELENQ